MMRKRKSMFARVRPTKSRAKDADEVIRAFVRVLTRLAPARGGAPTASGASREKP